MRVANGCSMPIKCNDGKSYPLLNRGTIRIFYCLTKRKTLFKSWVALEYKANKKFKRLPPRKDGTLRSSHGLDELSVFHYMLFKKIKKNIRTKCYYN